MSELLIGFCGGLVIGAAVTFWFADKVISELERRAPKLYAFELFASEAECEKRGTAVAVYLAEGNSDEGRVA